MPLETFPIGVFLIGTTIGAFLTWSFYAPKIKAKEELLKASGETQNSLNSQFSNLKEEFSHLSNEVLTKQTQHLLQTAQDVFEHQSRNTMNLSEQKLQHHQKNVSDQVFQLKSTIEKFDEHVHKMEKGREGTFRELSKDLEWLGKAHQNLNSQTQDLIKALKAPKTVGQWGELQLKRVMEHTGLLPYCHFEEQVNLQDQQNQKTLIPDVIIRMPSDNSIVIDAKAPIDAFLKDIEQKDGLPQKEFSAALRRHIQALSAKSYQTRLSFSPDFIILFLPTESLFRAALEQDPQIMEYASKSRIILASPMSLLALLKTIHTVWKNDAMHKNAKDIVRLSQELHSRVAVFSQHLGDVGKQFEKTVHSFNKAVTSLESRVVPTLKKMEHFATDDATQPVEPESQLMKSVPLIEGKPKTSHLDGKLDT